MCGCLFLGVAVARQIDGGGDNQSLASTYYTRAAVITPASLPSSREATHGEVNRTR
jgi:hypothetical protein